MSFIIKISNQRLKAITKQTIVINLSIFLDYDDKLARLHKLGIVNHRYKLPVRNIYERASVNSNLKGNYYASKSNGPKIEFTGKRIPTPVSKKKPDFIKLRSWFMDSSIRKFAFKYNILEDPSLQINKRNTIVSNTEELKPIKNLTKRKGRFRGKIKNSKFF